MESIEIEEALKSNNQTLRENLNISHLLDQISIDSDHQTVKPYPYTRQGKITRREDSIEIDRQYHLPVLKKIIKGSNGVSLSINGEDFKQEVLMK